jgi:hypothetical protein
MTAILAAIPAIAMAGVCFTLLVWLEEPKRKKLARRILFGIPAKQQRATKMWSLKKRITVAFKILFGRL